MKNRYFGKFLGILLSAAMLVSMTAEPVMGQPDSRQNDLKMTLGSGDMGEGASPGEIDEQTLDAKETLEYTEGEALVVYHSTLSSDSGEEISSIEEDEYSITDLGFKADKIWNLAVPEDKAVSPLNFDPIEELAGDDDDKVHDSNTDDVRIALVKSDDLSTEALVEKLNALDCVEVAEPNYIFQPFEEISESGDVSDEGTTSEDVILANEAEEIAAIETEEAAGSVPEDLMYQLFKDADQKDYDEFYHNQTEAETVSGTFKKDPLYRFHGYSYASGNGINLNKAIEAENAAESLSDNVVAVIDTGLDYNNPDLVDNVWWDEDNLMGHGRICGMDCVTGEYDPMPYDGLDNCHGVHIAGSIAARTGNGIGVAGVAGTGHTKVMGLKVMHPSGGGYSLSSLVEAYNFILEAKKAGYNLVAVNNSWGNGNHITKYDSVLNYIITQAGRAGILTFFAAGNSNTEFKYDYESQNVENPYIVVVSSSDANNHISLYSSYSEYYSDVAAPGSRILSTMATSSTSSYRTVTTWNGVSSDTLFSVVSADDWKEKVFIDSIKVLSCNEGEYKEVLSTADLEEYKVTLSKGKEGQPQFTFDSDIIKNNNKKPLIKLQYRIKNPFYKKSGLTPSDYSYITDIHSVFDEGQGDPVLGVQANTFINDGSGSDQVAESVSDVGWNATESKTFADLYTDDEYLTVTNDIYAIKTNNYRDYELNDDLLHTVRLNGFSIGKTTDCHKDTESDFAPYDYMTGTSMATPVAVGMAAEIASLYNITDALELRGRVIGGTEKLSENKYVHTDPMQDNKQITHKYCDMVASGGRVTFDKMLNDDISDYNANIWSVDVVNGDTIYVNGYALKDASIEVDGISINDPTTDDRYISFKAGSNLMDGKRHKFIVTDAETGRTYKAELVIPQVISEKTVSLNFVCGLPDGAETPENDCIFESSDHLYYGDGNGEYLYSKQTVSSDAWTKLKAPGRAFTKDKEPGKSYSWVDIRYFYSDGSIYAVYSDAVSKGSENGNVNMYINRYDVSSDSWEGYKTIMSDEDAALTAS
nr:S8 family serine peptidase [Lachnospiraceae bacterium]